MIPVYVETGSADSDQVNLDFYLSDTQGSTTTLGAKLRKWNIKVTQIPCGTTYTYVCMFVKYKYVKNIFPGPQLIVSSISPV